MLGVETIFEGSIQKSGNQLRVTAQLINAKDGFYIWSEHFDRKMTDIFALQDELAYLVVSKICSEDPDTDNKSVYNNDSGDLDTYVLFSSLRQSHIHDENN